MEQIEAFCRKWNLVEFSLFGSVLRDDFHPGSDVDVLVEFDPDAQYGFFAIGEMEDELSQILGRRVDLLTRRGVEMGRNRIRRNSIIESAQVIYARQ
jgi:predicted nucleotidyltransferase